MSVSSSNLSWSRSWRIPRLRWLVACLTFFFWFFVRQHVAALVFLLMSLAAWAVFSTNVKYWSFSCRIVACCPAFSCKRRLLGFFFDDFWTILNTTKKLPSSRKQETYGKNPIAAITPPLGSRHWNAWPSRSQNPGIFHTIDAVTLRSTSQMLHFYRNFPTVNLLQINCIIVSEIPTI